MANIEGYEFDWYAVDQDGSIAMFASGGSGQAPKSVLHRFQDHNSISDLIEQPNWGSSQVWNDYADAGFFVFDTDFNGGPFVKRVEPTREMDQELKGKILSIPHLPKFGVSFASIPELVNYETM